MPAHLLTQALRLTLAHKPFSGRRVGFTLGALAAAALVYATSGLGQTIDDLFFRAYRRQAVTQPLFIIATPRSGSTFLHRLLCLDEERFVYFKTYHTLLPSVTFTRALSRLALLDRPRRAAQRLFHRLQRGTGDVWQNIHPLRLSAPEEDEALFLFELQSPAFFMLFPYPAQLPWVGFTDHLPPDERERLMTRYRRSLQRFLYAEPGEHTLLSKNVFSCGRLLSLAEAFPDARFVLLVRHPYEGIPSLLSLITSVWQLHAPDVATDGLQGQALAEHGYAYYRHLVHGRHTLPPQQVVQLRFEDLVQDPLSSVRQIYQHFDLPLHEDYRHRLETAVQHSRHYQSQHNYSLGQYGLSKEMVYAALRDTFTTFAYTP
jgi:hypothetical protein